MFSTVVVRLTLKYWTTRRVDHIFGYVYLQLGCMEPTGSDYKCEHTIQDTGAGNTVGMMHIF